MKAVGICQGFKIYNDGKIRDDELRVTSKLNLKKFELVLDTFENFLAGSINLYYMNTSSDEIVLEKLFQLNAQGPILSAQFTDKTLVLEFENG